MRRWVLVAVLAVAAVVAGWLIVGGGDGEPAPAPSVRAHAATTDAQGRAVLAVERFANGRWRAALARGNKLDTDVVEVPVSNPRGVAMTRDGAALVAGSRRGQMAVARVGPDGTTRTQTIAAGSGDSLARAVVSTRNGATVVAGDATEGDRHALAIATLAPRPRVQLVPDATAAAATVDRDGNAIVAGTDTRTGGPVLVRRDARGRLQVTRARTRLASARWRAVAAKPDGGVVMVGSGRGEDARSLIAVHHFGPRNGETAARAGDGDAFGTAVVAAPDGQLTIGATGVDDDQPTAYVADRGRPTVRGPGSLVALLADGTAVVNRWDGNALRPAVIR